MLLRLAGGVRQLDGLRARTARVGAAVGNDVLELDAISFSSQSVPFEVIHAETIGRDAIGG